MTVPPPQPPPGGWQPGPQPQPQPQWGAPPPQQMPPQQMPPHAYPQPGYGPPRSLDVPTVQLPGGQPFRPGPYQSAPPGYPPGNSAPPRKRRWLKPTLIAAVVAAVAGGGVGIASAAGAFGTVFDKQAMERDIPKVLAGYYPNKGGEIGTVTCPADQPTTPGHKFTCTVVIGKETKTLDINVREGTEYTVSLPR